MLQWFKTIERCALRIWVYKHSFQKEAATMFFFLENLLQISLLFLLSECLGQIELGKMESKQTGALKTIDKTSECETQSDSEDD